MSLRNRLLTWAVGLGATLLPGCAPTLADLRPNPLDHIPDLPDLRTGRPESPYHQQGGTAPGSSTKVERIDYRDKPIRTEEPPPLKPIPPQGDPPNTLPELTGQPVPADKPAEKAAMVPQEGRRSPPADEPLVVALRAYLQKRPPDALDALARYEKANQEMLLVALPFIARLTEGDVNRMPAREAAELADMLQGVEDRLRQRAALRIDKMLFCRKIDDFGDYVARESVNGIPAFEGGAGDQPGEPVQVYVELRNVSSKRRGDYYETSLAGSIELLDFAGRSAYREDFEPKLHRGQSPRHDFFVSCSFCVPRKVPPGRYTLRVEVRDITGLPSPSAAAPKREAPPAHRVARQTLDFQVTEPRANRAAAR
jgi:hypothetical protein